jgi:2-C-methyl-D-erythritol 4-phosphate cytidylyltransferase
VGAPKALRHLAGQPLLVHAVRRLAAAGSVASIVVAAPAGAIALVEGMLEGIGGVALSVVEGGATRQESVARALAAVQPGLSIVLVHDAARPLIPPELVDEVAAAVRAGHDVVVPVLPVTDTIRRVDAVGAVLSTVDRASLRAVQTPQGFSRAALVAAHAAADVEATDDATLAERIGLPVHTVPGRAEALKVTTPFDLLVAEALLSGAL